jgi:hypothetical protein
MSGTPRPRWWALSALSAALLVVLVASSAAPATVANAPSTSVRSELGQFVTPGDEGPVGRPRPVRVSPAGAGRRALPYGAIMRPVPNTLIVIGRPPNLEAGEADIANAILYRSSDTLYVIDSGATPSFRPFLRLAISDCARSADSC